MFLSSTSMAEKHENINSCSYQNDAGVESFKFICDASGRSTDFFDNTYPIDCNYNIYYKERRHINQIYFEDCFLKELPIIFKWYKAVHTLNVSYTDLETIRGRDFDYAEKLETLIASHNKLAGIPFSLFSDAKEISYVDFSYNNIKIIDPLAFSTRNNLTTLILSHNLIESFDSHIFTNLDQLETLQLDNNLLETIDTGLFTKLMKLNELDLGFNRLMKLDCGIFTNLVNLRYLKLSQDSLHEFNSTCIRSEKSLSIWIDRNRLTNLTLTPFMSEIYASENDIEWIYVDGDLSNLTALHVSKNHIKNIVEIIERLGPKLTSLDVSDSPVGQLDIETFSVLDNLQMLWLRNTSLSNIQYGTFHHQKKLQLLDISSNNLTTINFGMLRWSLKQLQSLHLDANMLKNLDNLTIDNFPELKYLSIDQNMFDCDYLSNVLIHWEKHNIVTISNPNLATVNQHNQTHINETTCYHDANPSSIKVPEMVHHERDEKLKSYVLDTQKSNIESSSTQKVEILLIFIAVMLVCLVAISVGKHLIPAIKSSAEKK